jgi:hypothetical protein
MLKKVSREKKYNKKKSSRNFIFYIFAPKNEVIRLLVSVMPIFLNQILWLCRQTLLR